MKIDLSESDLKSTLIGLETFLLLSSRCKDIKVILAREDMIRILREIKNQMLEHIVINKDTRHED